ncbi:3-phosphoserine/phosphohydroxythreonine transaminase [Flavobacterium sp. CBA20B-1]|uniref:3-phosphoserine/phosphohydroxythreonine transaminase n=1 Tax=unclassified Flavobacterium TaxID=196869 RepID=UPI002224AE82|nr:MULTISPECIES: 3-phosphoserine/phosphohydroxythreonine transaminase [unclassified Flavobacterium]WCM42618.1 3-phosphoserine/phosphohydroxythreonine transaminase [Flavobacterium sp. CBA20B-1]
MKIHNFSSGPSILPKEVLQKASEAVVNFNDSGLSLIEISHRDPAFVEVLNAARSLTLELLDLKDKGFSVLFLQGGASMEFVRIATNLLNKKAGYINTGNWANNAQMEASFIGEVQEIASSKDRNYSYIPKSIHIPQDIDYVHITSNNTIYGTQYSEFPTVDVPLVCDMSSDLFSRVLDFSKFDLIYACAQKNAGTSGVNLVVIKNDILGKIEREIPNIMNYSKHIEKESMYNTPAVFSVYVSYLTLNWIKDKGGIAAMERRNRAKAHLMYSEIDRNSLFYGTAQQQDRSIMNAVFYLNEPRLTTLFDDWCIKNGIYGIKGHRTVGGYRASMYNALPIESVQHLVGVMQHFEECI